MPAVAVQARRVPHDLPAVLVPEAVAATLWRDAGVAPADARRLASGLVVRLSDEAAT